MKRDAHQVFTDMPEFGRSNSCMIVISEEESEGFFKIYESGQFIKIELHSLSNEKFRRNAQFKLNAIKEVVERGLAYLEMMAPPSENKFPALTEKAEHNDIA